MDSSIAQSSTQMEVSPCPLLCGFPRSCFCGAPVTFLGRSEGLTRVIPALLHHLRGIGGAVCGGGTNHSRD